MKLTNKKINQLLSFAAKEALVGIKKKHGGPFGAIITKGHRVIATSHNTVIKDHDPTCHAEIKAISKACRRLKNPFLEGCVIFSSTEPCPMCMSAISWARIPIVVYGTSISDVAKLGFNEIPIKAKYIAKRSKIKIKLRKVRNKSCEDLLSIWKKLPEKDIY